MKGSRRAFTLPELLVVLAILAILAGTLVPVFFAARSAAKKAACMSNFKQAFDATMMYTNDYDDTYMPINHQPAGTLTDSKTDRTWVQLILPYGGDFGIFRCPADNSDRPRREATFDSDLIPGDTYSQYYTASLRTNLGFNFIYFSPIYQYSDRWAAQPKITTEVAEPTRTFLFIDSVWGLDQDGEPTGGGSWLVVPPCRYDDSGYDSFGGDPEAKGVYTYGKDGWDVGQAVSPLRYGQTWPWHNGHMTTISADGHARELTPDQLADGCTVRSGWKGTIDDVEKYEWDLR